MSRATGRKGRGDATGGDTYSRHPIIGAIGVSHCYVATASYDGAGKEGVGVPRSDNADHTDITSPRQGTPETVVGLHQV